MPNRAQRNLSAGEVAPSIYGRVDIGAYQSGLRILENGYVLRTGGVQSRPGTVYKGTTKGSGVARLVPCVFDDDQNYVLEFGNLYVRFWRDGAPVEVSSPAAWVTATAYTAGEAVENGGDNYVCILAHTSGASTEPGVGASWETNWYLLVGNIYELPTPYATAILSELQFAASLGVLRIAHNTVAMEKLVREGETEWYFAEVESEPSQAIPTNLAVEVGGVPATAGTNAGYKVTAYSLSTLSESLPTAAVTTNVTPSGANIHTVSWTAASGATSYRIYKSLAGGAFGYVASVTDTDWADDGSATIDSTTVPPEQQSDFTTAGAYPGVLGAFQQRIFHGGSTNQPDFVRASASADLDNFTVGGSITDSSALSYRMVNSRVVRPRHFVDVAGRLVQFSNIGEVIVEGGESGIITPTAINPRFISQNGCAVYPAPLPVHDSALYVQARGSLVRDLRPTEAGSDLTLTASHLVDGYTLTDWCYQQTPNSIVWAVRSDGVLLSLTYQRESGVFGWARHVTDGTVEAVCCVPEGTEDAVYLVVNRTINGSTVRYIERLANRQAAYPYTVCADSAVVATGVGSHAAASLSLDFSAATFTASGSRWTGVVATASAAAFASTDAGRSFNVVATDGNPRRCVITTYTNTTTVTLQIVAASDTFTDPEVIASADWYWTSIAGLGHLEGETVSLTLDGEVISSPNAETIEAHDLGTLTRDSSTAIYSIPTQTLSEVVMVVGNGTSTLNGSVVGRTLNITTGGVTYPAIVTDRYSGALELTITEVPTSGTIGIGTVIAADDWAWTSLPYTMLGAASAAPNRGVRHLGNTSAFTDAIVGLPFTVVIETLDIDAVERTTKSGTFLIKQVGVWVEETLGLMAGDSATTLQPFPVVDRDENPVTTPQTAYVVCNIEGRYSSGGRIRLQHVDPTPLTVLAIMPHGDFPR